MTQQFLPAWRRFLSACAFLVLCLQGVDAHSHDVPTPVGAARYLPSPQADRIVVLPGANPATGFTVAWRTDARRSEPELQITVASDSPDLADRARTIAARTTAMRGSNGLAHHHRARIEGLQPDTLYAYRVQGANDWSEWFHVRTASSTPRPFSFLYFGDAQNSIKRLYSRVIREAWRRAPRAALMIHAGDLISGRDERDDDEWGEWFEAGGFLHASTLVVPAAGNHEHDEIETEQGERDELKSSWRVQFAPPRNGAPGLEGSTYYFDYQGVRFIVLDSTSALSNGTARAQAAWLEPLLEHNPHRWTVLTYHHPMFSAALGRDNPPLRQHWQPLFERYDVDLVLQGHDHVYGRGANLGEGAQVVTGQTGPVYVVSVAGPKQYRVSPQARRRMERSAENTQLYQIVHVTADRLRYESRTATGVLYDAFELIKTADGGKQLREARTTLGPERRCPHEQTPSGRRDRCWDGNEW